MNQIALRFYLIKTNKQKKVYKEKGQSYRMLHFESYSLVTLGKRRALLLWPSGTTLGGTASMRGMIKLLNTHLSDSER